MSATLTPLSAARRLERAGGATSREIRRHRTCATLFADDPGRGERMTAEGAGLYLDYSKNRVTDETLRLLVGWPRSPAMPARREAMFRGERINVSEDRSVLHVALRMPRDRSLVVDGVDVVKEVHEVLDRMAASAERVRGGRVDAATPASRSATWSTSGSAARTWGR